MLVIKKSGLIIALFIATFLVINSCKKKEVVTVDNETQSVVDNALADQEFLTLPPTTQQLSINTKGTGAQGKGLAATCDTLTKISGDTLFGNIGHIDPIYTVNIGTGACNMLLPDGKQRTGALKIRLTKRLRLPGAQMIVKMINYKAGNIQYSCDSMVITTIASNTLYTSFNVKLINGLCQTSNGVIKHSFDKTFMNYFKGNPAGSEPYCSVYGTSNGINRAGKAFSTNIPSSDPLIKHKNCEYIDKGIMELTPEGFKTRIVDYGTGNCDDEATFTVNGNTITFKLK